MVISCHVNLLSRKATHSIRLGRRKEPRTFEAYMIIVGAFMRKAPADDFHCPEKADPSLSD